MPSLRRADGGEGVFHWTLEDGCVAEEFGAPDRPTALVSGTCQIEPGGDRIEVIELGEAIRPGDTCARNFTRFPPAK